MSDKAEDLVRQLLEKTQTGKLPWHFVPATTTDGIDAEDYQADLEDGSSFLIGRRAIGDNKLLTFQLTQPGRVLLSAQADNFPISTEALRVSEQGEAIISKLTSSLRSESIGAYKIARFRLFSDLFHAARKNAVVEDQAIEKVQQLLEQLG